MYNDGYVPQGWQCPVCKRIFSPTTPWCFMCANQKTDNIPLVTKTTQESHKCEGWHVYDFSDGTKPEQRCFCVPETPLCSCNGDKSKCNYYGG